MAVNAGKTVFWANFESVLPLTGVDVRKIIWLNFSFLFSVTRKSDATPKLKSKPRSRRIRAHFAAVVSGARWMLMNWRQSVNQEEETLTSSASAFAILPSQMRGKHHE